MMWFEAVQNAARMTLRYPGRSALTVLGLAIGVGAFVAMVSFGEGARRAVLAQFQPLGVNVLRISTITGVRQARGNPSQPLTAADATAIRRDTSTVRNVLPIARRNADVSYAGQLRWTMLYGTPPEFTRVHDWEFAAGGMFDEADLVQRTKVCVLGATPARELFGSNALGETLTVSGMLPCRVIGVLAEKGHSTAGSDLDDLVILPVTTYTAQWGVDRGYTFIEVEPLSVGLLDAASAEISDVLRRTHRIEAGGLDDFSVTSPMQVVRAVDQTSSILTALLRGIAALALLVGGIGIMNIQLVSVAERTEEIGIRAAIGAPPSRILKQFLLEAAVLSCFGSLCGALLGVIVASIVAGGMGWPRVIGTASVIGSTLFGIAVGVIFGYLPAHRAARLDPIQALRHE